MFRYSSTSALTPGWDERRRVELVDHRRALEAHAGREVLARVDGRVDRLAVEVDRARLGRLGQRRVRVGLVPRQLDLLGRAGRDELEPVELDRRVVAAVGELALVLGVEALDGRVEVAVERDLERAPLAEIAHRDRALERHAVLGDALRGEQLAALVLEPLERLVELVRVGVRRPGAGTSPRGRGGCRPSGSRAPTTCPGGAGTSTVGTPSSFASAAPCSGPAPPKTTSANSRGS